MKLYLSKKGCVLSYCVTIEDLQSKRQSRLLASYSTCSTKTKGSGKDRFLGDPEWSSEM